jgi:hypothetical protein
VRQLAPQNIGHILENSGLSTAFFWISVIGLAVCLIFNLGRGWEQQKPRRGGPVAAVSDFTAPKRMLECLYFDYPVPVFPELPPYSPDSSRPTHMLSPLPLRATYSPQCTTTPCTHFRSEHHFSLPSF